MKIEITVYKTELDILKRLAPKRSKKFRNTHWKRYWAYRKSDYPCPADIVIILPGRRLWSLWHNLQAFHRHVFRSTDGPKYVVYYFRKFLRHPLVVKELNLR